MQQATLSRLRRKYPLDRSGNEGSVDFSQQAVDTVQQRWMRCLSTVEHLGFSTGQPIELSSIQTCIKDFFHGQRSDLRCEILRDDDPYRRGGGGRGIAIPIGLKSIHGEAPSAPMLLPSPPLS